MESKNCRSCIFAQSAIAPPRMVLICDNKHLFEGQFYVVSPEDSCCNYQELTKKAAAKKYPENATCLIPLSQGKYALVDAEDYPKLARHKWSATRGKTTFYALRHVGRNKKIMMHRDVMNPPDNLLVDHIDHNGLNNTKNNLRLATYHQNNVNRIKTRTNKCSSKYKGVSLHKRDKLYHASICCNGKKYKLGSFKNETDAAKAYDKKARKLFCEFACLNFPDK